MTESDYFTIPPGTYEPKFYLSNPTGSFNIGWHNCSTSSSNTFNFEAGFYYTFEFSNYTNSNNTITFNFTIFTNDVTTKSDQSNDGVSLSNGIIQSVFLSHEKYYLDK